MRKTLLSFFTVISFLAFDSCSEVQQIKKDCNIPECGCEDVCGCSEKCACKCNA